ncbi:MAG: hypothetical protein K2X42_04975 [Burkholderiaceae bacterium]|nr:hypothetical protein [Burkholderiaceae bacterium]
MNEMLHWIKTFFGKARSRDESAAMMALASAKARQAVRTSQMRRPAVDFATLRAAERTQDQMLSELGTSWLETLSPILRPHQLCSSYPRVANRLALCWNDPVLSNRLLDDLLGDSRGNRKGFPHPVAVELKRLRRYAGMHAPEASSRTHADPWSQQATVDR